jgi:hypothetical protein
VRALFYFYAFFFFLFNYLKRERVKRGRNGAEGKRGASEEKTGSSEDGVFIEFKDLARKQVEILGFFYMPVPTWRAMRRASAGARSPGFPAAVDELASALASVFARRRAARPARRAQLAREPSSLLGDRSTRAPGDRGRPTPPAGVRCMLI